MPLARQQQSRQSRLVHNPFRIRCSICGRDFKNRSGLTQHHNRMHARLDIEAASANEQLPRPDDEGDRPGDQPREDEAVVEGAGPHVLVQEVAGERNQRRWTKQYHPLLNGTLLNLLCNCDSSVPTNALHQHGHVLKTVHNSYLLEHPLHRFSKKRQLRVTGLPSEIVLSLRLENFCSRRSRCRLKTSRN